ncbi:MAG: hypothetical protein ACFFD2_16385 [Promethearchaeota archaeon]
MKEVATLLGDTSQTLRNWSNKSYILAVIGNDGHRRFKISEVKWIMNLDAP